MRSRKAAGLARPLQTRWRVQWRRPRGHGLAHGAAPWHGPWHEAPCTVHCQHNLL